MSYVNQYMSEHKTDRILFVNYLQSSRTSTVRIMASRTRWGHSISIIGVKDLCLWLQESPTYCTDSVRVFTSRSQERVQTLDSENRWMTMTNRPRSDPRPIDLQSYFLWWTTELLECRTVPPSAPVTAQLKTSVVHPIWGRSDTPAVPSWPVTTVDPEHRTRPPSRRRDEQSTHTQVIPNQNDGTPQPSVLPQTLSVVRPSLSWTLVSDLRTVTESQE